MSIFSSMLPLRAISSWDRITLRDVSDNKMKNVFDLPIHERTKCYQSGFAVKHKSYSYMDANF